MRKAWRHIGASAILIAATAQVAAFDKVSLEAGSGNKTHMARIAVQWDWHRSWFAEGDWEVGGYWSASMGNWRARRFGPTQASREDILDAGITPVVRLRRDDGLGWYGELGIGVHWLSDRYVNNGKELSTHFQFGDHIGVGYVFAGGAELGMSFQHISNGSIKKPNDGVNFTLLKLAYPF